MPGDLVGGVLPLEQLMGEHKARQVVDKQSVMTPLLCPCLPKHPLRLRGSETVLATDRNSSQLLFFQRSNTRGQNFPLELFNHPEVLLKGTIPDFCMLGCIIRSNVTNFKKLFYFVFVGL